MYRAVFRMHPIQPSLVPQATSLVNFTQLLGGIVGIAIAGTIFGNRLRSGLAVYAPDLPHETAVAVSQSVAVIRTLSGAQKEGVVRAYSEALGYIFLLGIPSGVVASGFGLMITNFNLKQMNIQHGAAAAA
ncbi:hypothetical protein FRC03_001392 [Tulasnella sp. 419]|nr:hypothetical protein FRC03_001392 [Tulasnella sp. 419]